jgi:IrrE N-terminal-like domain
MMSIDQAKRFAENDFPAGPEKLADKLRIDIEEAQLAGCDGWVLCGPEGTLIRLNSSVSHTRRRFTLAHELSHLLLGVPTVVGESVYDSLNSNSVEERKVNDLASELLLPESIVRKYLPSVPVVAAQLRRLASKARVSELAVAIRVANLAVNIGLMNASVAFFQNGKFEWHWSKTLIMPPEEAVELLEKANASHPEPARIHQAGTNDVVVASLIKSQGSSFVTLFVQLLPSDVGNLLSNVEKRQELEAYLFRNDNQFRMQLQGVFGAFRSKCSHWPVDVAFTEFYRQKGDRWVGERRTRLHSKKGREYVRLRLQEFCS